jgi:hypothetical protein
MMILSLIFLLSTAVHAGGKKDVEEYELEIRNKLEKTLHIALLNNTAALKSYTSFAEEKKELMIGFIIGPNNSHVIFDCNKPSLLILMDVGPENKTYKVENARNSKKELEDAGYKCEVDDEIWYDSKSVLIQDMSGSIVRLMSNLTLSYLGIPDQCGGIMELHNHPAFVKWENNTLFNKENAC